MRLSASDLACRRGGRDVFAGVNFAVESGEGLTIRGRNGAGKSSLLRMVVGLVRVAAGRLDLAGGDAELTIGEQAHYLGHQDALKPSLSVGENLRFCRVFSAPPPKLRNRLPRSGWRRLSTCQPPTFPQASGGAFRSPAFSP